MNFLHNRWAMVASLPTLWFLAAYGGTTVLAAMAYVVFPSGVDLMRAISIDPSPAIESVVGSPRYLTIVLLPLVIVPAFAFISALMLRPVSESLAVRLPALKIDRLALAMILLASFCYGIFKLNQFDALGLDVLTCGASDEKLSRRIYLLENIGYPFFALAYGVNMMTPILAYLAYEKQGKHKADLALFVIALLWMVFFVLMTYSKAPLLVFVIMMASAVFVARAPLRHILIVAAVCGAVFMSLSFAVNASQNCSLPPTQIKTERTGTAAESGVSYVSRLLGFGVVQRMAAAVPFYLHRYEDPEERCGLQGIIRGSIGLAPQKCVMSVDVFEDMWPDLSVTGQQPAPSNVAAYGEIGYYWAIIVMVLCGICLGGLGSFAAAVPGALSLALAAAASGFAYFLTQVPFFAAFTYPHGLIPFVAPIMLLATYSALRGLFGARHHARKH